MADENKISIKERWKSYSKAQRIGAIVVAIVLLTVWAILSVNASKTTERLEKQKKEMRAKQAEHATPAASTGLPSPTTLSSSIPTTNRNQGLEDMQTLVEANNEQVKKVQEQNKTLVEQVKRLNERLSQADSSGRRPTDAQTNNPVTDLNTPIPAVDFNQPGLSNSALGAPTAAPIPQLSNKSSTINVIEPPNFNKAKKADPLPAITIPKNAIIESVMLSGINAMVNVSTGSSVAGAVTSAKQIGTPFIARVKGSALLPNGWKVAELDNCFISGSGIGVLSTEKANVIADSITCVDPKGKIFEAKISAFGVDLDGIQGISGHLVTKQGSLLLKTALAGIASGLGQALTPQPITNINTGGTTGSTPYTTPSGSLIAGTALGTGVSNSMAQLSKFYLDYSRQIFPVVEVIAGTRITWILQQSVDLQATTQSVGTK